MSLQQPPRVIDSIGGVRKGAGIERDLRRSFLTAKSSLSPRLSHYASDPAAALASTSPTYTRTRKKEGNGRKLVRSETEIWHMKHTFEEAVTPGATQDKGSAYDECVATRDTREGSVWITSLRALLWLSGDKGGRAMRRMIRKIHS